MKKHMLSALLFAGMIPISAQASLITSESFESVSGTTWSTTGTFNDGVNDHFGRTDGADISNVSGAYSGATGSFYIAGEDQNDSGGDGLATKVVTLNQIDIFGFSSIMVSGDFAAGNNLGPGASNYDVTDFLLVEYSLDGGGFQNGLRFSYDDNGDNFNEPIGLDANFDGASDSSSLNILSTAFTSYNFDVADGGTLDIRITTRIDSSREELAYDNFVIEGIATVPTPPSFGLMLLGILGLILRRRG